MLSEENKALKLVIGSIEEKKEQLSKMHDVKAMMVDALQKYFNTKQVLIKKLEDMLRDEISNRTKLLTLSNDDKSV